MDFQSFASELTRSRNRRAAGLIVVEHTESTLILGRRLIEEYVREGSAPPETDLVAWHQTAGRGRHGRSWSSPPGAGIYATLVRRLEDRDRLVRLPLVVAVALCDPLNRLLDDRCRLKWPNDLVVGGRKLGGILIESVGQADETVLLVAFGINHTSDLTALEKGATSLCHETAGLAASPAGGSLATVAAELMLAVDTAIRADDPDVADRYRERSSHRPGDIVVHRDGERTVEGRFVGFDRHGRLRLEVEGGERIFSAGEVAGGP